LGPIGIVAALEAEAHALGTARRHENPVLRLHDGALLAISGIGAEAAAHAARRLVDAGAQGLVSWGMAGALDPALRAGDLVLPGKVITPNVASISMSADWRDWLAERLAETIARSRAAQFAVCDGVLLTSPVAIDTVAAKAAALRTTLAVAVDMESAAVATVAVDRGLPCIAVRAIVDTAADCLPRAVLAASRSGQVRIASLARELLRAPHDIAPLLRLVGRYRAAKRTLLCVARVGLNFPQSGAARHA